jgi:hypothetical protein
VFTPSGYAHPLACCWKFTHSCACSLCTSWNLATDSKLTSTPSYPPHHMCALVTNTPGVHLHHHTTCVHLSQTRRVSTCTTTPHVCTHRHAGCPPAPHTPAPLTDTPGVHLHHRVPHMLSPEELKLLHPRRRLQVTTPSTPLDLATSCSNTQQVRHTALSYHLSA